MKNYINSLLSDIAYIDFEKREDGSFSAIIQNPSQNKNIAYQSRNISETETSFF